jgi:hypothetical protein
MGRFQQEIPLIRLLDEVADGLADLEPGPILLAECPNKFNDADQDDLWYAVQAGKEYWEQSHFFKYAATPSVRERSNFSTAMDSQTLKDGGVAVTGDPFARLRGSLRHLQTKGWRGLIGKEPKVGFDDPEEEYDGLIALVVERGQGWLVLERPDVIDAEIFAWDGDGLFLIGGSSRVDQRVGHRPILLYEWVEEENVPRLGLEAQSYFEPIVREEIAGSRLAGLLWQAVAAIREITVEPFALFSHGSHLIYGSDDRELLPPKTFSRALWPRESELRRPNGGVWPKFSPRHGAEPEEMSAFAKAMHVQLGLLEDADWRGLFATACGENESELSQLSLLADRQIAVLARDNAAFGVIPDALLPLGVFDCSSFFWEHDKNLWTFKEAIRQRS